MRRSFKEHVEAYCKFCGYEYSVSDEDGRWVMRIDRVIRLFDSVSEKNVYVASDIIFGYIVKCKASEWQRMCDHIGVVMQAYQDFQKL